MFEVIKEVTFKSEQEESQNNMRTNFNLIRNLIQTIFKIIPILNVEKYENFLGEAFMSIKKKTPENWKASNIPLNSRTLWTFPKAQITICISVTFKYPGCLALWQGRSTYFVVYVYNFDSYL